MAKTKITYPLEWSDRDRMNYLLAPFPPSDKPLNLDDPKLSFWSSLILSSSKELGTGIITSKDLQRRLKWNESITPGCLEVILESMERTGDIRKLSEFCSSSPSWFSWGVNNIVKQPITWALKSYLPASKYEGEYVICSITREYATSVLLEHQTTVLYKSTDNVMKYEEFVKLCLRIAPGDNTMVTVIAHQLLGRGQLAKVRSDTGYEVVKLSPVEGGKIEVTDVDIGVVSIKEVLRTLSEQIKMQEEAISRLRDSAKEKLKNKDKKGALRCVHASLSKKSVLKNKEAMLDNIHDILQKIQSAETDAMVYQAYKTGLEALKFMNNSQGLTLGKAEDVIADLKEAEELNQDISAVLSEAPLQDDITEEELLHELEGYVDQEAESKLASSQQKTPADDLDLLMTALSIKEDTTAGHLLLPSVPDKIIPESPGGADNKKPSKSKLKPLLT